MILDRWKRFTTDALHMNTLSFDQVHNGIRELVRPIIDAILNENELFAEWNPTRMNWEVVQTGQGCELDSDS